MFLSYVLFPGNDIAYPRNGRVYMGPDIRLFRPRVGVANPFKHTLMPGRYASNEKIHVLNPRHSMAARGQLHRREGHANYPNGPALKPLGHVSIQYLIRVSGQ